MVVKEIAADNGHIAISVTRERRQLCVNILLLILISKHIFIGKRVEQQINPCILFYRPGNTIIAAFSY